MEHRAPDRAHGAVLRGAGDHDGVARGAFLGARPADGDVLLVAPLAVPAFVNRFAWVSLAPWMQGFGGALLIVTLSYFPLVYLPVAAAFRGLDPAFEETARALGLGPWRTLPGGDAAAAPGPARRRHYS